MLVETADQSHFNDTFYWLHISRFPTSKADALAAKIVEKHLATNLLSVSPRNEIKDFLSLHFQTLLVPSSAVPHFESVLCGSPRAIN